eukprot:TRINITY_DN26244_c0_g1_i3.p2 TRINITY_DN26244_c0_g1~~TRINITY_DN26244_c0_g1_i3.p2  ORF type:complete len:102 (+),score=22.66 TRINITY_DN26244_c0_g1_i3:204-509(+)
MSPRQVLVCPIATPHLEFGQQVQRQLAATGGYYADLDASRQSLKKKIRQGQVAQYNYFAVIGDKEAEMEQVNVRLRDGTQLGTMSVEELTTELTRATSEFS